MSEASLTALFPSNLAMSNHLCCILVEKHSIIQVVNMEWLNSDAAAQWLGVRSLHCGGRLCSRCMACRWHPESNALRTRWLVASSMCAQRGGLRSGLISPGHVRLLLRLWCWTCACEVNGRVDHLQFAHVELDVLRFGCERPIGEHHTFGWFALLIKRL